MFDVCCCLEMEAMLHMCGQELSMFSSGLKVARVFKFLFSFKSHAVVGRRIRSLRRAKARRQGSAVRAFVEQIPLWTIVRQDEAGWMSFRVEFIIRLLCVNQSITLLID